MDARYKFIRLDEVKYSLLKAARKFAFKSFAKSFSFIFSFSSAVPRETNFFIAPPLFEFCSLAGRSVVA
jgi:hypothetical protein